MTQLRTSERMPGQSLTSCSTSPDCMRLSSFFASSTGPGQVAPRTSSTAWGETRRKSPARADTVGELLEAGFSGVLARRLANVVGDGASAEEARAAVKAALARELRSMSSDADIIDRGGVYALVGPTGVGKTTTTAKLAARCVVRHGAEKLALITTDGYRIGAQEQLRIYTESAGNAGRGPIH